MKINSKVTWYEAEESGYVRCGNKIFKINDLDIQQQEKYWKLLSKHTLEELQDYIADDENFNKFVVLLKTIGGVYDETNIWTAYEREYQMRLKGMSDSLRDLNVWIVGEPDLVERAEINKQGFNINNEDPGFGILIGRKSNMSSCIEWERRLKKFKIPYLPVLFEDFSGFIGPLVIPDKTPCLNCAYGFESDNLGISKRTKNIIQLSPDGCEPIPDIFFQNVISQACVQIVKYLIRMQKNQNPLMIANHILEVDLMNDVFSWHRILRNLECQECFPQIGEDIVSDWLNMERERTDGNK